MHVGTLYVRRSTLINALPQTVWEQFTSFKKINAWFGIGHKLESYEPKVGGSIRLSADVEGNKRFFGGNIVVFDKGKELSFSENWEIDPYPYDCFITIRLSHLYDQCHVELFHHGLERLGELASSELQGHEEGWHSRHLGTLKKIVEQ